MADKKWLTTSAGVKMPRIIYGTAWKKDRTADLVVRAVQAGFRGIDTACQPKHYNEAGVGEALVRLREQGVERETLFLQTKFTPLAGQDPERVPYDKEAPPEVQVGQSFETSKKNLQTDYIDSLVLHSPIAPYTRLVKVWGAMETLHQEGGVGQLGISNCYDPDLLKQLHTDVKVKPAVLQNRFYRGTDYDSELRAWGSAHGVVYQSFWTLTANPEILKSGLVQSLAEKYERTPAQVFFRYLSQSGICPLTGTQSAQHMREDLSIFDFELVIEEIKQVSDLLDQE